MFLRCVQVATNYYKADITPRQKKMLDFALPISQEAYAVNDEAILDIGASSAFWATLRRDSSPSRQRRLFPRQCRRLQPSTRQSRSMWQHSATGVRPDLPFIEWLLGDSFTAGTHIGDDVAMKFD